MREVSLDIRDLALKESNIVSCSREIARCREIFLIITKQFREIANFYIYFLKKFPLYVEIHLNVVFLLKGDDDIFLFF